MRIGTVPSRDLLCEGLRLNAGFFLSEDEEATRILRHWSRGFDSVGQLCHGRGVFSGPIFRIIEAADEHHGRPYVSAKDIIQSDIQPSLYLSNKHGALLDQLEIREGMILITCSGMNLGKVVWARADMAGYCASGDLIRLEPNPDAAPPGFLFAFLASRFGHVAVRRLIYGGHIKHVEPSSVAGISVPRLDKSLEKSIHEHVEKAGVQRSTAAELRHQAFDRLNSELHLPDFRNAGTPRTYDSFQVGSRTLERLDAGFYSPSCAMAAAALAKYPCTRALGDVARVFQTNIFKRPYVDDAQYGYPYYSGSELFTYNPPSRGYLNRRADGIDDYVVHTDWLLMQDAGQLGGLIGRVMRVGEDLNESVVSNHLIRIVTTNRADSAFLFAVLGSPGGHRAVVRNAFGSSIPQLESRHVAAMSLAWPDVSVRKRIAAPILKAWDLEDEAVVHSKKAIALVERTIEEAI